jgi:streptogramin lyase
MEFDPEGGFVRALGDGLFVRPHGLRIDAEDNIWVTDVAAHFAVKFDPDGRIVMVLGVKGNAGEWHQFRHLRLFDEPNEVATGPDGCLYVPQGHGKAESCVLKFGRDGNFIKAWGRTGTQPGEFDIPHSIVFDGQGLLHIADRSNGRIQIFDPDGNFICERAYPGAPCGLCMMPDGHIYLAHGHTGLVMKLDDTGAVLASMGGQGKAPGLFGEAHYIALNSHGDIFVADPLNWRVQKFVKAAA